MIETSYKPGDWVVARSPDTGRVIVTRLIRPAPLAWREAKPAWTCEPPWYPHKSGVWRGGRCPGEWIQRLATPDEIAQAQLAREPEGLGGL